jgi:hypothetical protein
MADQIFTPSLIFIASTTTTTDLSVTETISDLDSTAYPGSYSTLTTTLSLYGPGEGSAPPVTQIIAGATTHVAGVLTVPKTSIQVIFPTAFLPRVDTESYVSASTISGSSSTTTSKPNLTACPNSKGLSSGDAAGIGIGSAILGALIALLSAWFLFRRRLNHGRRSHGDLNNFTSSKSKDLESPQSNDAIFLAPIHDMLPQPLSHSNLIAEMSQLGTKIKNHAANFYTNREVDIRILELEEDVLSKLGLDQLHRSRLLDMLSSGEGREREEAIRYIIAQKIFTCIQINGDPNTSFLPSDIMRLQRNMEVSTAGDGKSCPSLLSRDDTNTC